MNYPITLLAPARDLAVGKAAVQAGADAVYIGAPHFGARQAAGNSIDDIAALVQYAHPFGVKVQVTLNTLLTDDELPEAITLAEQLHRVGVDAFIVQDLRLAQALLPHYAVHASTQCDNRTVEQIAHEHAMGFKRAVLARELTIDEIRAIHTAVPNIELEAFIHGALCVSYSGRCYLSEVLMNRSANRGCCAQMCRMQYDLLDANMQEVKDDDGNPIHQRYLLSLQDMDRSMYLRELIDAGITTFKIEGRLKDADYVTNIVAYYRQKLDAMGLTTASTPSIYQYGFTPNPEKTFHRGGIDYFLHGRTPHMANWDTPKSTGEPITNIQDLHPGDGVCYGDQGFLVNGIRDGRIIANKPIRLSPHVTLYRNMDVAFLKSLHAERRILVDIRFEATVDGYCLTIGHRSQAFVHPHESAKNPDRAYQTIYQQLTKLGDTIYVPRQVSINTHDFIPISTLNEWRRQLTQSL